MASGLCGSSVVINMVEQRASPPAGEEAKGEKDGAREKMNKPAE